MTQHHASAKIDRREALAGIGAGAAALMLTGADKPDTSVPSYLTGYENQYQDDPRAAATEWFRDAKFGLFMHYGVYSLLGRGEWVMYRDRIPVAEYVKLKQRFVAKNFDVDFITDLALDAGMKYVNLTSRHHDSFSLFHTRQNDYHSVDASCGRDLVGELVEACREKGLGCFLYYSYAADWKHPYFYPRDYGWKAARPAYEEPQPEYKYEKPEDFKHYLDFVHAQLRELLTGYGPVTGIWLDPIMGYYLAPELFPIEKTYGLIRSLQPQCLISFKQGASGDEDFAAPERKGHALDRGGEVAKQAWEKNRGKPLEICDTLQPRFWGYAKAADGKHRNADEVMQMLANAEQQGANLLLNTGPLPDGSIPPADVKTLREVGRRLRRA